MDVVVLDPTTYRPVKSVKKFDELVWTERYRNNGDFKLVVTDDISIRTTMPIGSMVSHNNTRDIMMVEDHEIERKTKDKLTVTITGRSLETFFENRMSIPNLTPENLYNPTTEQDLGREITGSTYADIAVQLITAIVGPDPDIYAQDALPNVTITSTVDTEPVPPPYLVPRGDLYGRILELLDIGGYGISVFRPSPTNLAETDITFLIHDGENKVADVQFIAQNEDLLEAKYFISSAKNKNVGVAVAKGSSFGYIRPGYTLATGWAWRPLYIPVTEDIEGSYDGSASELLEPRARLGISDKKALQLLSCKVSDSADALFKVHYNIGDIVAVIGEFGFGGNMRVVEHILTSDKEGTRGYPSLDIV